MEQKFNKYQVLDFCMGQVQLKKGRKSQIQVQLLKTLYIWSSQTFQKHLDDMQWASVKLKWKQVLLFQALFF